MSRALKDVSLDLDERFWGAHRVNITTIVHRRGRKRHPLSVTLLVKQGDPGTYLGLDMTWEEVKYLHGQFGRLLTERAEFKRAVKRAKEGR